MSIWMNLTKTIWDTTSIWILGAQLASFKNILRHWKIRKSTIVIYLHVSSSDVSRLQRIHMVVQEVELWFQEERVQSYVILKVKLRDDLLWFYLIRMYVHLKLELYVPVGARHTTHYYGLWLQKTTSHLHRCLKYRPMTFSWHQNLASINLIHSDFCPGSGGALY